MNLNIASMSGMAYDELRAEGEGRVDTAVPLFFGSENAARIVVCNGAPDAEIVAEAKADASDLIVLTASKDQSWKRFLSQSTARKVIDASPCSTVVLPRNWLKTHINRFHPNSHFPIQAERQLSAAA